MKEQREFKNKQWKLVQTFKGTDKLQECINYLTEHSAKIDNKKEFILVNNINHIILNYPKACGLYREIILDTSLT